MKKESKNEPLSTPAESVPQKRVFASVSAHTTRPKDWRRQVEEGLVQLRVFDIGKKEGSIRGECPPLASQGSEWLNEPDRPC